MKNTMIIALLILNVFIWSNVAKADDYNTAVIGHVVKETVTGDGVDTSVLEAEMQKLAYNFSLQMVDVLEKNLPMILESLAAQLRQNADSVSICWLVKSNAKVHVLMSDYNYEENGDLADGGNTTVIPTKNVIKKFKIADL